MCSSELIVTTFIGGVLLGVIAVLCGLAPGLSSEILSTPLSETVNMWCAGESGGSVSLVDPAHLVWIVSAGLFPIGLWCLERGPLKSGVTERGVTGRILLGSGAALLALPKEAAEGNGGIMLFLLPWALIAWPDTEAAILRRTRETVSLLCCGAILFLSPAIFALPLLLLVLSITRRSVKLLLRASIVAAAILSFTQLRTYGVELIQVLGSGSDILRAAYGLNRVDLVDRRSVAVIAGVLLFLSIGDRIPRRQSVEVLAAWILLLIAPVAGAFAAVAAGGAVLRGISFSATPSAGEGISDVKLAGMLLALLIGAHCGSLLADPPSVARSDPNFVRAIAQTQTAGAVVFNDGDGATPVRDGGSLPYYERRAPCLRGSMGALEGMGAWSRLEHYRQYEKVKKLTDGWQEILAGLKISRAVIRLTSPLTPMFRLHGWTEEARSAPSEYTERGVVREAPFVLLKSGEGNG